MSWILLAIFNVWIVENSAAALECNYKGVKGNCNESSEEDILKSFSVEWSSLNISSEVVWIGI